MLELLVGELKVIPIWIEHIGCIVCPTRVVLVYVSHLIRTFWNFAKLDRRENVKEG